MATDGPNKEPNRPTPRTREAVRRFEDAFQKETRQGYETLPEKLVAVVLSDEAMRIVLLPTLDSAFRERFLPAATSSKPTQIGYDFTAHDGTIWRFSCFPKNGLTLKKFTTSKDGIEEEGAEVVAYTGSDIINPPVTKFSKGKVIIDETRRSITRRIEHEGVPVTYPTDIGWRGMLLLMDLEEAMSHPPIPAVLRPPIPEPVSTSEEAIEKPGIIQPERRALGGELDERFQGIMRMGDLVPKDGVDREDPKRRLSRLCDEAEAWVEWQEDTPFVDENGRELRWRRGDTYYYAATNEEMKDVRLVVRAQYKDSNYSLDIRELKENDDETMADAGQVTLSQQYRGRHAQWRDPGVPDNLPPTLEIYNEEKVGPNSVKALNKAARAYSMLHDGFLIGYQSETGGFVPAHRLPRPK